MNDVASREESYLLRRAFAFLLDLLILAALVDLGTAVYSRATGNYVAPVLKLGATTCAPGRPELGPDSPPVDFAEWDDIAICTVHDLLHGRSRFARFSTVINDGDTEYTQHLVLPVGEDGTLERLRYGQPFQSILVAALLAISELAFAAGPGKKLLGLRVQAVGGNAAAALQSVIRNGVRFLPLFPVWVSHPFAAMHLSRMPDEHLYSPGHLEISAGASSLLLPAIILVATLAVWVVPPILARVRGTIMPHNRLAQTRVARTRSPDANETGA